MKIKDLTEFHLAIIVATSTIIGGMASSLIESKFSNVNVERQTDAQLLSLAIGVLGSNDSKNGSFSVSEKSLRRWAVDTVNAINIVKFSDKERNSLINGAAQISFGIGYSTSEKLKKDPSVGFEIQKNNNSDLNFDDAIIVTTPN